MRLSRPTASALLSSVLMLGLLLCACGNNTITIKLDLDSFMSESSRTTAYDLPAVFPGFDFDFPRFVETVELPEGINEIIGLESMEIEFSMDLNQIVTTPLDPNTPVLLDFVVRVYLASSFNNNLSEFFIPENLFFELLVSDIEVTNTESTRTISEILDAADFLPLFQNNEELFMGTEIGFGQAASSGAGVVEGEAVTQVLHLSIVGTEDLFN